MDKRFGMSWKNGQKTEVIENQPFDEAVDVGETSDVASEYTPTPRGPARVNPLPAGIGGANRRSVLVNPLSGAESGAGGDPVSPSASLSTTPLGTGRGSHQGAPLGDVRKTIQHETPPEFTIQDKFLSEQKSKGQPLGSNFPSYPPTAEVKGIRADRRYPNAPKPEVLRHQPENEEEEENDDDDDDVEFGSSAATQQKGRQRPVGQRPAAAQKARPQPQKMAENSEEDDEFDTGSEEEEEQEGAEDQRAPPMAPQATLSKPSGQGPLKGPPKGNLKAISGMVPPNPKGTSDPAGAMYQSDEEDDDDEEGTDSSDDDDDDDEADGNNAGMQLEGAYDPADYENLPVTPEIKDLFGYITKYIPQTIDLEYKLKPFIPDYIPAVGDIDAFLKVSRPDEEKDSLGLMILDEPCAKQSDPTVLDLQLRAITKQGTPKGVVVKSVDDSSKIPRAIGNWIGSISELHRSKPPASVHYSKNMPDVELLMQEWPPEFEELLKTTSIPSADLECSLSEYVTILSSILDVPIYPNNTNNSKVQALHVLFSLYAEFKNSQHFQNLAEKNKMEGSGNAVADKLDLDKEDV